MADEPVDAVLEALWSRALDSWSDPRAHVALLEHAVRAEALPELASRYRALTSDPARATIAQQRLEAIVAAAMSMLQATKAPPPPKVPAAITLSALGVCAVLLGWLAWALWGHP
jgi:hypothetical protein